MKQRFLALLLAIVMMAVSPLGWGTASAFAEADKSQGAEKNIEEKNNSDKKASGKNVDLEGLFDKDSGKFDILIHFTDDGVESLPRKERAEIRQKEAVKIIEKAQEAGGVEKWESYYISSVIHLVTKDKNLVKALSKLTEVDKISHNSKVKLVEPIKKRSKRELFVPDERNIEWGVSMIHADSVWEKYGLEGEGITVGIIDTGVNYKLEPLKSSYKGYDPETGTFDTSYYKDFVDGLEEPQASHVNDHGTHVAGTICGAESSTVNRIGVAPKAKFISARVLDDSGSDAAMILSAAEWMLEKKPDVINNSWGGTNDDDPWFSDTVAAWREAGIVPVFAAGNQLPGEPAPGPGSIANPGNLLNVFAVGAVDINKKLGSFSKKGPSAFDESGKIIKPDVVAPGVQVRSIDALGNYVSWNGTSMATPHVAAAFALLKEANPSLSVQQMEEIMRSTTERLTDRTWDAAPNMAYGYGLVNVYDAVSKAKGRSMRKIYGSVYKEGRDSGQAELEVLCGEETYAGRDLKIVARAQDDVSIRKVYLEYSINGEDKKGAELKLKEGDSASGEYEGLIDGSELRVGDLTLTVKALDFGKNETVVKKTVKILPGAKIPAKFDFEGPENGMVIEGRWNVVGEVTKGEPPMGKDGSHYIGIDGGSPAFKTRVDSYLYLPPIDLSTAEKLEKTALVFDQYQGFSGISTAQVQVSTTGKADDWHVLYDAVIRPDITERSWRTDSFDLSKYQKEGKLLHIRFYFYGHDADEGCGWYLDNISIQNGEKTSPAKIEEIKASLEAKGLRLTFRADESTDMDHYDIYRSSGEDFTKVASLTKDEGIEFVQPDEGKTHYVMNWVDQKAEKGKNYRYKVQAVDIFGNKGDFSDVLLVNMKGYSYKLSYDFDQGDGGFLSKPLTGETNDWQHGQARREDLSEGNTLHEETWNNLLENHTGIWGLNLTGRYSGSQNSALYMPKFTVDDENTHFFFDSYDTVSSIDRSSFTVEIRDAKTDQWTSLVTKEEVQDNRYLRNWRTIEKSLAAYKGKEVEIRFRADTGKTFISDSDLGWYIDNVLVAMPRTEFTETIPSKGKNKVKAQGGITDQSNGIPEGIPLRAKILVVETGRYTFADQRDGSYSIPITENEAGKPYTVEFSAYGYETKRIKVDLTTEPEALRNVILKPAKQIKVSGKVRSSDGRPLDGVLVRAFKDDNIPVVFTDEDGSFELEEAFTGELALRYYKEGYEPVEKTYNLIEDGQLGETVLLKKGDKVAETTDYGINPVDTEDGYQTVHFRGSMKGAAVRFQAPFKGSTLKYADIFFVNNNYYKGRSVKIGVLAYDKDKRLVELAPFRQVENLRPNEWNRIDFEEYNITTDAPIYIAAIYPKSLGESAGIFYDTNAPDRAKERSFIYDGSFISTSAVGQAGAYGMQVTWEHDRNAKVNPESPIESSGVNLDEVGFKPLSEDDFVIDQDGVITAYKGEVTSLKIPEEIRGIKVTAIGDKAFDGTGKVSSKKLVRITIPEGVKTIGENAFINNNLQEILLPNSLTTIEKGAFKFQWKDGFADKSLKVNIPSGIRKIEDSTFESAGTSLTIKDMDMVESIGKNSFAGIGEVVLYAPSLREVADKAFGTIGGSNVKYAVIFTDSGLESRDGEFLVNPATVIADLTDAKDDELVYKRARIYGPNNPLTMNRDVSAGEFYTIGDEVEIAPIDFREDGIYYTSIDSPQKLVLEKENNLRFFYYPTKVIRQTPVLDVDEVLRGFTVPGGKILLESGEDRAETKANEDGYFEIAYPFAGKTSVNLILNDKYRETIEVEKKPSKDYIAKDGKILRYLGDEKDIVLPSYIEGAGEIQEVGPFAFAGKSLKSLVIPQKLETISAGAFMGTGLEKIGFDVKDLNITKLRAIHEYAFRDNKIKKVSLGELQHVIRTSAFENNEIESLELGRYIGHIGSRAFKNNKLEELVIPGNVEDIGEEAFMNNRLEFVTFTPPPPKGDDASYLSRIEERTFAGNPINSIEFPKTVTFVAGNAFENNAAGGESEPGTSKGNISDESASDSNPSDGSDSNDSSLEGSTSRANGAKEVDKVAMASTNKQKAVISGKPETSGNPVAPYLITLLSSALVFLNMLRRRKEGWR